MFKFNFDIEDQDDTVIEDVDAEASAPSKQSSQAYNDCAEIALSELLDVLPSDISFSPVQIPLSSGGNVTLSRRDLFDTRFQLIAQTGAEPAEAAENSSDPSDAARGNTLDFVDAPSDLVPGIYEGGLKTWECSLDVVEYLHESRGEDLAASVSGRRVLEIGCGTAIPSLYLLKNLFEGKKPEHIRKTELSLQDYNRSVLELVTLPNILLSWYMSSASALFRSSYAIASDQDTNDETAEAYPPADPSIPGEIAFTPALKSAFLASLSAIGITLRFFSGSWDSFSSRITSPYDLIITSETIYRTDTVGSLIDVMRRASVSSEDSLTAATSRLSIGDNERTGPICLVAAKVFYFGVGGGVTDFARRIEGTGAQVETVWERKSGVARQILSLHWPR